MKIIATLAGMLLSVLVWGQNHAEISGRVFSAKGALPYATVKLQGTGNGSITDEEGRFVISGLREGTYVLEVSAVGFKKKQIRISTSEVPRRAAIELERDILGLQQVVVTGTRNEVARKDVPVVVSVLNGRLLDATQSQTLSEGLNFQPGLRLETNCQNCGFSQVRMNGLEGAYAQILIDGRPVFSALQGIYGLDQIPAAMIDRIEVVRGGGSALFGSNAIAGTINIVTKEPVSNTWQLASRQGLTGGRAYEGSYTLNATLADQAQRNGWSVFGVYRNRTPYDANADGFSEITQLLNHTLGFKGHHKTTDFSRIGITFHAIDEYRRGGNLFDRPPHETDIAEMLDQLTLGGQLSFEHYSRDLTKKISVYASLQHIGRDSYYGGGGNIDAYDSTFSFEAIREALEQAKNYYGKTDDWSWVSGTQFTFPLDSFGGNPVKALAGSELIYNRVEDRMPGYGRFIRQQVSQWGNFAQLEMQPFKHWRLLAGARADYIDIDGFYAFGVGTDRKNKHRVLVFSPRVNLLHDLTPKMQVRAGWGSGFRAPQAFDEDLHVEILGGSAQFHVLGKDLQPERSESFTLSADRTSKIGSWDAYLLAAYFYTRLKDPFVHVVSNAIPEENGAVLVQKQNGPGGAIVEGLNLEGKMSPGNAFFIDYGATFQTAKYEEVQVVFESESEVFTTKKLLRTPDLYGFLAGTWSPSDPLRVNLSSVYTGSMKVLYEGGFEGPDGDGTPALVSTRPFLEWNAKLSWKCSVRKKYQLEFMAGIQNITNAYQSDLDRTRLRDPGYVYGPSRPRTWFAGLKLGQF